MIVLAIAIPLGLVLHIKTDGEISNFALVNVGNILDVVKAKPINVDFGGITANPGVFVQYVILFALIGSIESLLTVKAIDGMDPYRRKSKVSYATIFGVGLVDPKVTPEQMGLADG